jgi:hypothetical protein
MGWIGGPLERDTPRTRILLVVLPIALAPLMLEFVYDSIKEVLSKKERRLAY